MTEKPMTNNRRPTTLFKFFFVLLSVVGCWSLVGSVQAQSVDLLWQGEGYVPPFYEGKNLWSKQSEITFFAVPQDLGNPSNLYYEWSKNGTVLGSLSGIGKNTLVLSDTVLSKPMRVLVQIIDQNEKTLALASATVAPREPELLIYENSPLYGYLFNREAGSTFTLNKKEVTFSVFPLFAASADRSDASLIYKWRADGVENGTGHSVTYRVPDGVSGKTRVEAVFTDSSKIMRNITKAFLVEFNNE